MSRSTDRPDEASRATRWLWWALAYAALALGLLGVVLPGLPTTPFILLAAWAAARGSRRLHAHLLAHRTFGPMIRDWQHEGAVSRRAKWFATLMMLACAAMLFAVAPNGWAHWPPVVTMALVSVWLWRRPEPGAASRTDGDRASASASATASTSTSTDGRRAEEHGHD